MRRREGVMERGRGEGWGRKGGRGKREGQRRLGETAMEAQS